MNRKFYLINGHVSTRKIAQQSVQRTAGSLRQSQAVFYALPFFQLDGFAVPVPAQVTQTVGRLECQLKTIQPDSLFDRFINNYIKESNEYKNFRNPCFGHEFGNFKLQPGSVAWTDGNPNVYQNLNSHCYKHAYKHTYKHTYKNTHEHPHTNSNTAN